MNASEFLQACPLSSDIKLALGVKSKTALTTLCASASNNPLVQAKLNALATSLGWGADVETPNTSDIVRDDITVEGVDIQHFITESNISVPMVHCVVASAKVDTERLLYHRQNPEKKKSYTFDKHITPENPKGHLENWNYGRRRIAIRFGDKVFRVEQVFTNLDELIKAFEAKGKSFVGSTVPIKYDDNLLKGNPSILTSASPSLLSLTLANQEIRESFAQLSPEEQIKQRESEAIAKMEVHATTKTKAFGGLVIE
jgi:hypothetical protein